MERLKTLSKKRSSPEIFTNIGIIPCIAIFFVAVYVAWNSKLNSSVWWWSVIIATFFGLSLVYILKARFK